MLENINFYTKFLDQFRKMSCYITQDDRIQSLLTVIENMRIAADFKLGNSMEPHEKEERVCVFFHSNNKTIQIKMF